MSEQERDLSRLKGSQRVRLKPSVILGSDGIRGVQQTLFEVVSNSIDRWKVGYGETVRIIRHSDHSFTIIDEADGLPCSWNEEEQAYNWDIALKTLYGGDNYIQTDDITGKLGNFGLGLTSTMYSSEYMSVIVYKGEYKYTLKFKEGRPVNKNTEEFICEDDDYTLSKELGDKVLLIENNVEKLSGTIINYKPDSSVFTDIKIPSEWIKNKLKKQAVANIGLVLVFKDEVENAEIIYKYNSIADYVDELGGNQNIGDVILFNGEAEGKDIEIRESYKVDYTLAIQFNNNINIQEYYHNSSELTELKENVTTMAIKNALTSVVHDYILRNKLYNKKESKIKFDDIEDSLICVLSSRSNKTSYANQTKLSIDNPFIKEFITNDVKDKLSVYFIENPLIAKQIVDRLLINKRSRERAESSRNKIKKELEGKTDNAKTRPSKFVDCRSKDKSKRRLTVIEGDSALNAIKNSRDRLFDAILPLKGKVMNVLKKNIDEILANEEIRMNVKLIGAGVTYKGKAVKGYPKFDINLMNFIEINILSDADEDGFHIRCLYIAMVYILMQDIIINGMLKVVEAPLYRIIEGDIETGIQHICYDELERTKVLEDIKTRGKKIGQETRFKGLGGLNTVLSSETIMSRENRRVKVITIEDAKECLRVLEMFLDEDSTPRREYIEEHGHKYFDADMYED